MAFISISVIYIIIAPLLNKEVFGSLFIRLVFALFCYVILLQAILVTAWIFNRDFSLNLTIIITLVFSIGLLIYQKIFFKKSIQRTFSKKCCLISVEDTIALIIATLLLFVVGAVPLITRGINNEAGLISIIGNNSDDASHLAYINDRIQFDRGVLYQSDAVDKVRSEGQTGIYPAGWHSVSAIIIKAFNPSIRVGTESLTAYALIKLAWYFILVYLFARAVFIIYKLYSPQLQYRISFPAFAWMSISILFFGLYFTIDIFSQGFYSFIPQLISTILLLLVFMQTNKNEDVPSSIPLLSLLSIGGSLSWFLTLPAFVIACVLHIASLSSFTEPGKSMQLILKGSYYCLPLITILVLAALIQYYVMSASPGTVTFIEGILLNGKIITYPTEVYLFTFIGLALLFFFLYKKRLPVEQVLPLLLAIITFAGLMYLLQKYYTGQNMYYFYKVMYLFLIIAIPLGIASIGHLIVKIYRKNKNISFYSAFIFLAILIIFTPLPPPTISYIRGARNVPLESTTQIHNTIDKDDDTPSLYYKDNYVLFFNPGDTEGNDISTLLVKANKIDSQCFNKMRPLLWSSTNMQPFIVDGQKYCTGTITIFTSSNNYERFNEEVQSSNGRILIKQF